MSSATSDLPSNVQSSISQAKTLFDKSFGKDDRTDDLPIHCASAPGRVNLIGEHTDYTGGYVLPLAIGFNTVCYGRGTIAKYKSTDAAGKSRIVSTNNPIVEFHVSPSLSPLSSSTDKWANYVQGVILQYLPDLQSDETFVLDMAIAGDVPLGSGLSSSASLEVATAVFLECIMLHNGGVAYSSYKKNRTRNDTTISTKEIKMERAIRCQRAENLHCGVPCGIMDQFVSSAGCQGKLLLIDCRSLEFREVSVGSSGTKEADDDAPVLVVANSNVKHDLGDGEYPVRVQQCKDATDIISKVNPRIKSLRDASMEDIDAAISSAGLEGVLLQRARHVVSENKRTVETANALEKGDWKLVGQLMNESHNSMKNDYEVSCDEIDVLVDLAQSFDGVHGSRLTGGGFGGCTVTLVKKESSQQLMDYLNQEYEKKTGKQCDCFATSPGDGARAIHI
ncbi:hypothetical protein ACHAXR_006875 [Thalassiosira sp. AJA248-18]